MITLITITICALAFAAYVYFSHNKIAERKAEAMLAKWKFTFKSTSEKYKRCYIKRKSTLA